jgi:hypothetical protein
MKTKRIRGLLDVIEMGDVGEIRAANELSEIDRELSSARPIFNGFLLNKLLAILSYRGKRFPTMLPRLNASRAHSQKSLWVRLESKASFFREGPAELDNIARWLSGTAESQSVGLLLQEQVGRIFEPSYKATPESWAAAVTMAAATRTNNPFKLLIWRIGGRIRSAREVLAEKVSGDGAGIHATGIAIHNLVAALSSMKALYRDIGVRESLSPEQAAHRSLVAPAAVLRQATAAGSVSGCPFRKGTVVVLKLSDAFKKSDDEGVVFQRGTWSQCPAEQWVPALLAGIWSRATKRT